MSTAKILVVDDDAQALESMRKILEFSGYEVLTAGDGEAALELMRPSPDRPKVGVDLILSDVRMPKLGGLEFLRALSLCGENTPMILMTAFGRVEDAVWAMKLGAVDFLTKPFKRQTLVTAVESAIKRSRSRFAPDSTAGKKKPGALAGELLVGRSGAIAQLRAMIAQVAPTTATVLVTGESGTGKELVARCLHRQSARANSKFIALNCAAVPEQLIESELFGFEKGSFTGATGMREGLFEAANGGTLLLDEIGDMPLPLQATLLRTLQEGEVRRIGSNQSRKVDVRMIAATNRDLRDGVRSGSFRQDLLYRLEVITIQVPPLRERMEDLPDLVSHFLGIHAARHGKTIVGVSDQAMQTLLNHSWPGNIRELANVIERAVVFAKAERIEVADLPPHLAHLAAHPSGSSGTASAGRQSQAQTISVPLGTSLKEVEELLIRKTLEATAGDKNMTARLLGINSRTVYRKLDKRPEPDKEA